MENDREAARESAPEFKENRSLAKIRRWTYFLDEAFRIPGTKFRFGWDPIIGLVPGFGDLITGLFSVFLLFQAFRLQVPHIIKARMILNVLIDVMVGAVPLIGDVFDFAWKSNVLNRTLLERYAGTGERPGISDWVFVLGVALTALIVITIPVMVLIYLFHLLSSRIQGPLFWKT